VIEGSPEAVLDPTLTADKFLDSSGVEQLRSLRTLTLTGNVSGLAPSVAGSPPLCNSSAQNNWGAPTDPSSPCFKYFPIIHHYGDLSLSGAGSGQGILLVEGNLRAQGNIEFYGPVIVTGAVNIRGTGGDDVRFFGGIIARAVSLEGSHPSGKVTVNYSSCAIRRALRGSATVSALGERSWMQLY
jgi:hypothetical protein